RPESIRGANQLGVRNFVADEKVQVGESFPQLCQERETTNWSWAQLDPDQLWMQAADLLSRHATRNSSNQGQRWLAVNQILDGLALVQTGVAYKKRGQFHISSDLLRPTTPLVLYPLDVEDHP